MLEFEWSPDKDRANQRKHGVAFAEASTIFRDPRSRTQFDYTHSEGEDRFATMGVSGKGRVLLVIHTPRGERVRIISARRATPRERRIYGDQV